MIVKTTDFSNSLMYPYFWDKLKLYSPKNFFHTTTIRLWVCHIIGQNAYGDPLCNGVFQLQMLSSLICNSNLKIQSITMTKSILLWYSKELHFLHSVIQPTFLTHYNCILLKIFFCMTSIYLFCFFTSFIRMHVGTLHDMQCFS